ncbi:MAG: MipA/OmpV family protein [Rhodoferax sp.]|uniref:MipA/OmpV family protein n=1 Tax=Rhodoferax sp. TaxID=50421 RepID=UPI001B7AD99D|nr:MipA/OmpV family protein [Rhodoferax sp.]MBP9906995.1 MipA/OmpV family protein [Rhodoferax sp.]
MLPWLTASASAGVGFGTAGFQSTYFGVSSEDSHLFPSLAGRSYEPGGGLTDIRLLLGGLVHLSQSWHVVVGARWQRLVGGAADSPLVRVRGNATQWMLGSGLVYTWR